MNLPRIIVASPLVLALAACATRMPTAPTGFLSNYAGLRYSEDRGNGSWRSTTAPKPAIIVIGDIEWRASAGTNVTAEEKASLIAQLRNELESRLAPLPVVPGGPAITVRAAITRIDTVSPALNTVSTMLLFAPVDRGGAAVEIEALDMKTQKQFAAFTLGYYAPMSDFKARFDKLAPAEIALKKAALDFASLLR